MLLGHTTSSSLTDICTLGERGYCTAVPVTKTFQGSFEPHDCHKVS